jgi:hypothetical protein
MRGAVRAWISGGSAVLALSVASALTLTLPRVARAQGPVTAQACNAAYERAQVARAGRKLRAARDELLVCSQSKCPGAITADCGPWLREVESTLPSVVVVARDPSGNDVPAVKVSVDGAVLAARLGGVPLEVDPGEHRFVFEPERGQRVEQTLLINVGEKSRLVQVTIRPDGPAADKAPSPEPAAETRGSLWPGLLAGTLGLGSLGASFGLYFVAKGQLNHLRTTCAPGCPAADVSSVRTLGIASDVTFGAGLAGLGASVLLFVLRPSSGGATPAKATATWLLAPAPGGAVGGVVGRF